MISLSVFEESKSRAGSYSINLQVIDLNRGTESNEIFICVDIEDVCSGNLPIQIFPEMPTLYELKTVMDHAVSFQNLSPEDCPLDLTLTVMCDNLSCFDADSPFVDVIYVDQGFYSLELYSDDEQLVGNHVIELQAIDILRGFKSDTIRQTVQIIPQCSHERISYDRSIDIDTEVRLRDESDIVTIDPKFLPTNYPECPISLI